MRRLLVLTVVLSLAALAFADDALVLPKGVIRARVTGAYTMATQQFDSSGDKVDVLGVDALNTFNIGAALEYGIVDGVNIAAQWIPGYIVYSKFDSVALDKAKINGPFDLFLGAKVQILGDQGMVSKSETMRFAAAAGAVVPLPGADFDKELTNALSGKEYIASDADKHVFGLGARGYFDYVINKMFFVNLYSEFIKYFKRDLQTSPGDVTGEYDYGYQLTLEAEPHFEMPVAEKTQLKAGLPFTYVTTPEVEKDGTAAPDTESYQLTVRPNVALFMTGLPLPIEIELGYLYPLAGKNVSFANSAVTFQLKAFAKF